MSKQELEAERKRIAEERAKAIADAAKSSANQAKPAPQAPTKPVECTPETVTPVAAP